jgi:predicted metal-dependent hydrolase
MSLMLPSNNHSVQFGSERIDFHLVFGLHDRFRVTVEPNLSVTVNAPHGKPLDQVLGRVKSKAAWITRQIRFFEQFLPLMPEKHYISGETIQYLGRQYRLKVTADPHKTAKLAGPYLLVSANRRDIATIKSMVHEWYSERAKTVFARRLQRCLEITRRYGIETSDFRVRRMKGRWGSCRTPRAILLNTDLVKAPVHCIDYVIMHELCHFRHPTHGDQFWRFLGKLMPDWRHRKKRLERVNVASLN